MRVASLCAGEALRVEHHGPGLGCSHPRTGKGPTRHSHLEPSLRMSPAGAAPKGQGRGPHLSTEGLSSSKVLPCHTRECQSPVQRLHIS